jgi:chitinase
MKNRIKPTFAILFTVLSFICVKSIAQVRNDQTDSKFRVVGYLRENMADGSEGTNYDFSRINYLNIAFINPNQDGNFPAFAGLNATVVAAHKKNVKVLASLGGGLAPAYYSTLLSDSMRNDFIKKTVQFVLDHQLDGIDVDLEGEHIDNNYENFVTGLSTVLRQHGKLLTAAVATVYKTKYTDAALARFDVINIMSYDKTGPWRPANPGQHSPYSMAVEDLDYWSNTRGIAKEKLSLGLPFYGYGFGPNAPQDLSYKRIVSQYPGSETADSLTVTGGGIVYYNGIPTIKAKTQLALQKAGGIMIWQLMGDADGDKSLLNIINGVIRSAGKE